jgi:hypothetical protein
MMERRRHITRVPKFISPTSSSTTVLSKDGKMILHTCATHWLALVPMISWILQCVQRFSAQRRRMARVSPWIRYRHALRLRKIARQTPEFAKTIALHTRSDMISSGCTTRGVQLTIHGINVSKLRYPNIV